MKGIKNIGLVTVCGFKFTGVSGGFGEDKKAMLVKDIAKIHGREVKEVNKLINNKRYRFKDGVDIIDLKTGYSESPVLQLGITKAEYGNSNNIYLLSERGYSKLLKIMDDDLAWDIYDQLVDDYFNMREQRRIPQTYAEALRAYADEVEESERLKAENEKQKLLLAEQQPKVEVYDTTMSTDGLLSFKQVADIIAIKGLGRNKLMEFLRSRGVLLDGLNKNRPAGKYVDAGYFKEVIVTYDNGYGKNNNTTTTYVTPEGLAFIISQVNKHYVTKSKKSNNK